MFSPKIKVEVLFRVVMSVMMLFNALAPTAAFAQSSNPQSGTPVTTDEQVGIETPTVEPTITPVITEATATSEPLPTDATSTPEPTTPVATEQTPVPADSKVETTGVKAEELVINLSANPEAHSGSGSITLYWAVTETSLKGRIFTLELYIPEGLLLAGKYSGEFDETSHVLRFPVETASGSIDLQVDNTTSDFNIEAVLVEADQVVAKASLTLPYHEEFLLEKEGGLIATDDGRIKVEFPKDALPEKTVIEIGAPSGDAVPEYSLTGKPFEIKANIESSKQELKQFSKELTISVSYADLQIPEESLSHLHLYWYDEVQDEWEALVSYADPETKTLYALTDHFTVFDIDVNKWEASHLPTVDAFQVSSFTGAATYSYPIEVPPGPGGLQPSIALTYNSQVVDQTTLGTTSPQQASWVGMGWSLDMGSIDLFDRGTPSGLDNTFMLNVAGVSSRIIEDDTNVYHTADENFWKVSKASNVWTVKDKQGNTYTFGQASKFPEQEGTCSGYTYKTYRWLLTQVQNIHGQTIQYSYANENKQVRYMTNAGQGCFADDVAAAVATYPDTITYANGMYRVRFLTETRSDYVDAWWTDDAFHMFERQRLDKIYVEVNNGTGNWSVIRRYELDYKSDSDPNITFPGYVWTKGGKTSTLASIKQYGTDDASSLPPVTFQYDGLHLTQADNGYGGGVQFSYGLWYYSTDARASQRIFHSYGNPDNPCYDSVNEGGWAPRNGIGNVTCTGDEGDLRISGGNATTTVTALASAMGSPTGTNPYVTSYNLLRPGGIYKITLGKSLYDGASIVKGIDAGPGLDVLDVDADNIVQLPVNASRMRPIIQKSGPAGSYAILTTYRIYLLPSIYRVSTKTLNDGNGHTYSYTYDYSNPALNSVEPDPNCTACPEYSERLSEFRGHGTVIETGPDGTTTTTTFHQDELLKGRPISTTVQHGSTLLSMVEYTYTSQSLPIREYHRPENPTGNPYVGVRHDWVYTSSEKTTIYGASTTSKTTTYAYESTYGNLTVQSEYEGTSTTPYRSTETFYTPNPTPYLVGLPARQQVQLRNSSGTVTAVLADTINLYDGAGTYNTQPTTGKLTATRTWTDGVLDTGRYSQVSYGYDAWGNPSTVTAYTGYGTASSAPIDGAQTSYTCFGSDSTVSGDETLGGSACAPTLHHNFPLWTKNAVEHTTFLDYDYALGVPLTEIDPNGSVASATYDSFGRIKELYRPDPTSGAAETSPSMLIDYQDSFPFTTTISQKINDTLGNFTVERVYDGIGRQTKITSGGTTVDTIYESATVTKQSVPYTGTSPNLFTVTTVNPSARTTTVTAPDNTSATTLANGLVTTVTDARGNLTTSTSDVWGRVVSVVPPTGPSVTYAYDELDRLLTATRGGAVTSIKYDNAGRKINMDDPDMGMVGAPDDTDWAWTYEYDALGNLTSQTDARECTLSLGYDPLNRLTSKDSNDSHCVVDVHTSYTYDGTNALGYRTSMTDDSGSASWTYDARGRVKKEIKTIAGNTYETEWGYNAADLNEWVKYPDTEMVTNTYNDRMLLNSVTGAETYVASTSYDAAGRITSRALGNTLTQNFTYYGWTETATVDSAQVGQGGRLKNTTVGSIQNLSYVYDAVGNIRTITDSLLPETQSYGYDTLDRLTSANVTGVLGYSQNYAYNATSGNLTTKGSLTLNYTDANHVHAVTGAGSNTYSYDANGNQITRVIGADTYNLKYDAENRLVEVKKNNVVIAAFTFDGDGKRVKSVINGTTTLFVGGGYEIKNPGTGQEITKYYFAGASRVAMRKYVMPQSPTVNYMLYDHLGSTNITTDASGAVVTGLRYKAWGEVRYPTNGTNPGPSKYTYTGQYSNVDDFGLMFYNARMYDPLLGRFTSADTVVPKGVQGLDRYVYVNNSPLNNVDPSGHFTEDAIRNYLWGQCKQEQVCFDGLLEKWQADTGWWNMLLTAQAGDTLFGQSRCCAVGGGMYGEFEFTFTGDGVDSLTGISTTDGTSLESIQQGSGQTESGLHKEWEWMGFYRKDEKGKPSFYVREGYALMQRETSKWESGLFKLAVDTLTLPVSVPWTLVHMAADNVFDFGLATIVADAFDIDAGDNQVWIADDMYAQGYGPGPVASESVYFNFQPQYGGQWSQEK